MEYNKEILANYLGLEESQISEAQSGLFLVNDSTYVVGQEGVVYNYLLKMIEKNAHKYVRKVGDVVVLLNEKLLSVKNINPMYYDLLNYMSEDELIEEFEKGESDYSNFLRTKINRIQFLSNDSFENKEKFKTLREDLMFTNDSSLNFIFDTLLIDEDADDFSKESMEESVEYIKQNMIDFDEDSLKSVIDVFSVKKNYDSKEIAEVISRYGAGNPSFVISLMSSVDSFAQGFSKIKGSYAACLDNKGEENLVSSGTRIYICNVSGLL